MKSPGALANAAAPLRLQPIGLAADGAQLQEGLSAEPEETRGLFKWLHSSHNFTRKPTLLAPIAETYPSEVGGKKQKMEKLDNIVT